MIIGIAGLGLIGGSLAKAYKSAEGNTVYGFDRDDAIVGITQVAGAIDGVLDTSTIGLCDCILIALYPKDTVDYVTTMAPFISKDAVVFDCCGVKRAVCEPCFKVAATHGFTFVGGHPMAGTHHSGFKHSKSTLFKGASMILVPPVYDDIMLFDRFERLLSPVGFGRLTVTTAQKHDEMIGFTSQMPHIVSNAYIKSPSAREHKGYSAGSYKDLTRVAWLNPDMWTELFLDNRDVLLKEMDYFIASMTQYRMALAAADREGLWALLDEGSTMKKELDGG